MNFPNDLKYTKDHEWVRVEGSVATIGITEFAQDELGEIVFVELPTAGKELSLGDTMCVVESTKAASDVYAPLSGKVVEGNSALESSPDLVNSSPYADGWIAKIEGFSESDLSGLMSPEEYTALVGS